MSKKNPFDEGLGGDPAGTVTTPGGPSAPAPIPAKDVDGTPYCPKHFCRMKAGSSGKDSTYFYCQVDGCKCSQKVARIHVVVPYEPLMCPRLECKNVGGVAMEVEEKRSRAGFGQITMVCPRCKNEQKIPNPFLVQPPRAKRADESLSDR